MPSGALATSSLQSPVWRLAGLDVALEWHPVRGLYTAIAVQRPSCRGTGATRGEALRALGNRLGVGHRRSGPSS